MSDSSWSHLPLTDLSYQVLLALTGEPLHGYAILKTVHARTDGRIEPESGTLYTAIRRLNRDGLLEPTPSDADRRRGKRYTLTEKGREILHLESARLARLVEEARRRKVIPSSLGARGV